MGSEVNILSETIQEFNGERFYLCGFYFQHKGKRLHRVVWEYHNGDIPNGYHVHHIDGDRTNNAIENLSLLQGSTHLKNHGASEERRENGRRAIRLAIEVAPEWHRSAAGKKWHSEHSKKIWENRQEMEYTCTMCGRTYTTRHIYKKGNHFCGNNCRARYGRRKRGAQT